MKFSFWILVLVTSCATFSSKDVTYSPREKKGKVIILQIRASFDTHLGVKYAFLKRSDVSGSLSDCVKVKPGESNDGYLKGILCKTYFSLKNGNNIALLSEGAETNRYTDINFDLSENTSLGHKVWSWANFLTLTVVPYRGERVFTVSVKQVGGSGEIAKFQSSFIEWRSIFLLPAMPFLDGYPKGTDKNLAYLLNRIDEELKRD